MINLLDDKDKQRIEEQIKELQDNKQDNLTAGDNVTIENGVISANGGTGGTSDYAELENKPSINGVELSGNKTTADLNINFEVSQEDIEESVNAYLQANPVSGMTEEQEAQLDALTEEVFEEIQLIPSLWVIGATASGTGANAVSTKRIRTEIPIEVSKYNKVSISINSGYMYNVLFWNGNTYLGDAYTLGNNKAFLTTSIENIFTYAKSIFANTTKIKVVVSDVNQNDITTEQINTYAEQITILASQGTIQGIKDEIASINNTIGEYLDANCWEIGGINTTSGVNLDATNRLRLIKSIKTMTDVTIAVNNASTYSFIVYYYDDNGIYEGNSFANNNNTWSTLLTVKAGKNIRINLRKSDNSDIASTSEWENITINGSLGCVFDMIKELENKSVTSAVTKYVNMGFPYLYKSAQIEDEALKTKTCADVYTIYDSLCQTHSKFIERKADIGVDCSNNPIRMYTIRFQDPFISQDEGYIANVTNNYNFSYDYKKIFINAGTHGNEKSSVYGVALAIEEILTSTEDWARYIRANYIIDVVPIANPSGFDLCTRNNADNVNINRDAYTQATSEMRAITAQLLSGNYDIAIDSHNSGGWLNYFGAPSDDASLKLYAQMAFEMAGLLQDEFDALLNRADVYPCMTMWNPDRKGMFHELFSANGIKGYLIESFCSWDRGDCSNGTKKYCKFTKDLLINSIISYGSQI